jgi:predicted nucleic acid-binding protein
MTGVLLDTSVYIDALRRGDQTVLSLRRAGRAGDNNTLPLWLSAVVLHELYLGANSGRARKELQRLEREFAKIDRLLVPSRADWTFENRAQIRLRDGWQVSPDQRCAHRDVGGESRLNSSKEEPRRLQADRRGSHLFVESDLSTA